MPDELLNLDALLEQAAVAEKEGWQSAALTRMLAAAVRSLRPDAERWRRVRDEGLVVVLSDFGWEVTNRDNRYVRKPDLNAALDALPKPEVHS